MIDGVRVYVDGLDVTDVVQPAVVGGTEITFAGHLAIANGQVLWFSYDIADAFGVPPHLLGLPALRFGDLVRSHVFGQEFMVIAGHEAGVWLSAVSVDGVRYRLLISDIERIEHD